MTDISTELLQAEFISAFQRVWETSIGLPLEPAVMDTQEHKRWIAGVVWIGGQWTGSVTVAFPLPLARRLTAQLLEIDIEEVKDEQCEDAVREIANMSAGNLKSSLPGPCGLATPGCFEIPTPHALADPFQPVITLAYSCQSTPFLAELKALH